MKDLQRVIEFKEIDGLGPELEKKSRYLSRSLLVRKWRERYPPESLPYKLIHAPIGVFEYRGKLKVIYGARTYLLILAIRSVGIEGEKVMEKIEVNYHKRAGKVFREKMSLDEVFSFFIECPVLTGMLYEAYKLFIDFENYFKNFEGFRESIFCELFGSSRQQIGDLKKKHDKEKRDLKLLDKEKNNKEENKRKNIADNYELIVEKKNV